MFVFRWLSFDFTTPSIGARAELGILDLGPMDLSPLVPWTLVPTP